MAASRIPTKQYDSEHFVEAAGAVIFYPDTRRICLVYLKRSGEWFLPKGRRNHGGSRAEAALREATEETGVPCRLLPVRSKTRAPPAFEPYGGVNSPNVVRVEECSTEPFMVTVRQFNSHGQQMKLIWWYVAEVDKMGTFELPEAQFHVELFTFDQAIQMLTYQSDREVVERAIKLFYGEI